MESRILIMETMPAMLESLDIHTNDDLQNSLILDLELIRVFVKHHRDARLISKLSEEITELYKKASQNSNDMGISNSQLERLLKLRNIFQIAVLDRINNPNFYRS